MSRSPLPAPHTFNIANANPRRVTSEGTVDFGGKGDGHDSTFVVADPKSSLTALTHVAKGKGGVKTSVAGSRLEPALNPDYLPPPSHFAVVRVWPGR